MEPAWMERWVRWRLRGRAPSLVQIYLVLATGAVCLGVAAFVHDLDSRVHAFVLGICFVVVAIALTQQRVYSRIIRGLEDDLDHLCRTGGST